MKSPLEHAAERLGNVARGATLVTLIGGVIAYLVGRGDARTRLHGRYVLAWMLGGFVVCGLGRIVHLLFLNIDESNWQYVPAFGNLGLLLGWPIGSLHGWFMLPPKSDGIDEDRSPGPHSS